MSVSLNRGEGPARVTFLASFAPLQSAWQTAQDGGTRIKLDIPESELDKLLPLLRWRDRVLRVTVEVEAL